MNECCLAHHLSLTAMPRHEAFNTQGALSGTEHYNLYLRLYQSHRHTPFAFRVFYWILGQCPVQFTVTVLVFMFIFE